MPFLFLLMIFFSMTFASADVGKVLKVIGENDAYLMRANSRLPLSPELDLQLHDEIFSENTYVVIHLFPGSQISFAKNTQIKISEFMIDQSNDLERTSSIIDFIKGIIRLQVTKESSEEVDQKIQAEGVVFAVRGTEFEISMGENDDVDLDVFEGQVEVSSPYIQSFVPEFVKANEGFKFDRKSKKFSRQRFAPKFRNHPGFENAKKIREKYRALNKNRKSQVKNVGKKARKERKGPRR